MAVCVLTLLLALPSHAGYWQVSYTSTGVVGGTSFFYLTFDSNPWPEGSNGEGFGDHQSYGTINKFSYGTVTPTLIWVADNGDMIADPPDKTVFIRETATAQEAPGDSLTGMGYIGSVDDGWGDPVITTSDGVGPILTCTGTHLLQRDGSLGVIVLEPVSLSAANPISDFSSGSGDLNAWWGNGWAGVSLDVEAYNPVASLVALGHLPTQHKEISFDPTTQTFVAIGVPNLEMGDTLRVDTGLPLASVSGPAEAPRLTYPIDYQGGISLSPVLGDSYTITASLNGGSDGGTEPIRQTMGLGGWYTIDPFRVNYTAPLITYPHLLFTDSDGANYDYSKPQLSPGDTGKIDGIDFNYTFISDAATAHKHLSVHLHMPTEWNQIGNLQGDPTPHPQFKDIDCEPSKAKGLHPITAVGVDDDNTIAFAYQGVSASFTALAVFTAENPPLSAFLAVSGYIADKAAPEVPANEQDDTEQNMQEALDQTAAAKKDNNLSNALADDPDWLLDWANASAEDKVELQAQCTWKLVQVNPYITFHWLGDEYGAFGYTGQVHTDVRQDQEPYYLHYYYTPKPITPVPPITPTPPLQ